MLIHSMSPARMLAEARKDLPTLRNKLVAPVSRLRKEHAFDPQGELVHMYPWASPRKNNWLMVLKCTKSGVSAHTLAWYKTNDGRTAALWLTAKGLAYHIDADVLQQYSTFLDTAESPLERLQSFFFANYSYAMQVEEPHGEHHWKVSISSREGLGLGEWDTTTDIVHWRTFIHHDQLFPEQRIQLAFMDLGRRWSDLPPDQRVHLVDRAVRVERERAA